MVNGRDLRDELKYLTGYVLQNDYLHPCLTVRECLVISLYLFLCFLFVCLFVCSHNIISLRFALFSYLTIHEVLEGYL